VRCHIDALSNNLIVNSRFPYYVFVALCIVVIVVSLIKIVASNENIECFREYFAVGYRAPDPSFFKKFLHRSGQKISHLEYQSYNYNHNAKRYENVIRGIANCYDIQ
jgi:hypothetical protein